MKTKKPLKGELFLSLVLITVRINEIVTLAPSYPKKVRDWSTENKANIIFGFIFAINIAIKFIIDMEITPFLIIKHSYIFSFITTNIIYALIGIISVFLYDKFKGDPVMIEALKKHQSEGGHLKYKNKLIKFILKRNKKNKFILNALLFFKNPGLMVIYHRDGSYLYNGFKGKYIKLLYLIYLLFMNLYWNTMVYFGISIWDPVVKILKELFFWYLFTLKMAPFF